MPDIDAFHQEQHVLGDVGGMVRDPLQAPGNPDQIEGLGDVPRILFHKADQLVVGGCAETVYGIIGSEDAAGHIGIVRHESVEALTNHGLDQGRHMADIHHGRNYRFREQGDGSLRDAHGKIAHAFEIGIDFERRNHQAQVGCQGLLGSQQIDRKLVDFHLQSIDARLIVEDLLRRAAVLLGDRGHAALNGRFHQRAHFQQLAFQLFQFLFEVAHDFGSRLHR